MTALLILAAWSFLAVTLSLGIGRAARIRDEVGR